MFQVTINALVKRVNRRLANDGEMLRHTRGVQERLDLGDYYVLDLNRNFVVARDVDPKALGREIGALRIHESVSG